MQTPPAYQPQYQPPKKNNNVLWIVLGVLAVCGCGGVVVMGAILFPVFSQAKLAAKKSLALTHVKRTATAMNIYAADYDDRLPIANTWMDTTKPYAKDEEVFVSPVAREKDRSAFGFAFRKALSQKNLAKLEDPQSWAMVFDSTILTRNAYSDLETLPDPPRYGVGDSATNMIGFADTHAKAMRPSYLKGMGIR